MNKWKTLSSKFAFDNPWFKVQEDAVELPNGKVMNDYLMWAEGDVAFAVPFTEDKKLVLVRQYKHAAGEILIEFPAGYLDKDEFAEDGVKRELLEETGYSSNKWTKLSEASMNPTKIIGTYHFYLAEECSVLPDNPHQQDETENIEVLLRSPEEVYQMLISNEIKAAGSVMAGYMGLQKLGLLKLQ
jgi:ADP-ribose pyrophosphatase